MQTLRAMPFRPRCARAHILQVSDWRPFSSVANSANPESKGNASTIPEGFKGRKSPIYVAATREHVGKTTTSLALVSGLQKRFERVGYMKPVGQKCVSVKDEEGNTCTVDKDVPVVHEHFYLDHCCLRDMSPVQIPAGYTRDYIDGMISPEEQLDSILSSYRRIDAASDVVLCEGTGHGAVGSVIDASNARVAEVLGGKMVRPSIEKIACTVVYARLTYSLTWINVNIGSGCQWWFGINL